MIPVAELSHTLPGRTRIRVRSKRGEVDYFLRVEQALATLAGVYTVQVNAQTGSILITHGEEALGQIAEQAQSRELFLLECQPKQKPVLQEAALGFSGLDSSVSWVTRGSFDFRSVLYVTLVGMGIVQIMRGQILAPAATLLWYAIDLLRSVTDDRGRY